MASCGIRLHPCGRHSCRVGRRHVAVAAEPCRIRRHVASMESMHGRWRRGIHLPLVLEAVRRLHHMHAVLHRRCAVGCVGCHGADGGGGPHGVGVCLQAHTASLKQDNSASCLCDTLYAVELGCAYVLHLYPCGTLFAVVPGHAYVCCRRWHRRLPLSLCARRLPGVTHVKWWVTGLH